MATQAYVEQLEAGTRAAREYEESCTRATESVRALQAALDTFSAALDTALAAHTALAGIFPDADVLAAALAGAGADLEPAP